VPVRLFYLASGAVTSHSNVGTPSNTFALDPFPPALTRPSGENRPLSSSARVTSTPLRPVAPATRTVSRSGSCAPHGGTIAEHAAAAPTWPRNSRRELRELCISLVVLSFLLTVWAWNKRKRSVSRGTYGGALRACGPGNRLRRQVHEETQHQDCIEACGYRSQ
jgi:hypothetical protein